MTAPSASRRDFLILSAAAGGGLALGIAPACATTTGKPASTEFSAWLEIGTDDSVTVRVPEPEIGNGAMTQIAMTIAEELECDWAKVRTVSASVQRSHLEGGIYAIGFQPFFAGHSTQQPRFGHGLQLGASARERLKAAAAARWSVPPGEVAASEGIIRHAATGRTLRYGEVAGEAARITLPREPAPKPREQWRLIGKKSLPKLQIPAIVTGKAVYGIDVAVPGMVHAALLQCPVQGGRLKSCDSAAALKMPGVRKVVVIDPAGTRGAPVKDQSTFGMGDCQAQHGVAVIADHYWQARTALEALAVEWDLGDGAAWKDGAAIFAAAKALRGSATAKPLLVKGDVAKAAGKRTVTAEYSTPWCENAALEPLNATVLVTADRVEAWVPTQDQQQAWWTLIDETGLPPQAVIMHATLVGGGFGRRTQADDVRMAAAVAKQYPGRPVKVIWSREEVFRQGRYRTPVSTRFRAVLDDVSGLPRSVEGDTVYIGTRPAFQLPLGYFDLPWLNDGTVPNVRLTSANLPVHVLNGAWRGPCYNSHAFFAETFVDECAHAAGVDPLAYRLHLLAGWDQSWRDCLSLAASKAGWGKELPAGEGLGLAISCWPMANIRANGTVVAAAARVRVAPDGAIAVRQVDIAFDCGSVANPDAVRAQMEGGTLYGLNAALNEELTLQDGAIVEGNFDAYPMLRMADAPPVNVHFGALSGHSRMAIAGEAPTAPVQAAVGNAIFAATGKRLRQTPFRKQDLGR